MSSSMRERMQESSTTTEMKTLVTLIAALLAAGAIILVGILSWACDNWVMGVVTGIALATFPGWVKESLDNDKP